MNKIILFFLLFYSYGIVSFGQRANGKMFFIIDSIPLLNDPEDWNPITDADIADFNVITNKDSLKHLGWRKMDGITYVFTKSYRNRPDSLKGIPGLKQMTQKDSLWYFNNRPYTGKYADYYNSGKIQNEGAIINGKLNGELTVYYKFGIKKSVADYKNGVLDGIMTQYYKNGAVMLKRGFTKGISNGLWQSYFINGQVENERKQEKGTPYDTVVTYFSTGKIKRIALIKNGEIIRSKQENDFNYYTTYFQQSLNTGDIKSARKYFYEAWLIDSASLEMHMNEGYLLEREFRFDEAITQFNIVLAKEPLERNTLLQRAISRIKKYKYPRVKSFSEPANEPLMLQDLTAVPENELEKICYDLQLADDLDVSDYYVKKAVPEAILNFCRSGKHR